MKLFVLKTLWSKFENVTNLSAENITIQQPSSDDETHFSEG